MVKRGRPKGFSNARDRMVTVCLSEKAAVILDRVKRSRGVFNFSEYVSRRVVDDFGDLHGLVAVLKRRIGENNKAMDVLVEENSRLALEIKELQDRVSNEVYL